MIYGKTNVQSIAMKADRSSAMVSLNTSQTTVSLNIYKNSANIFGRKTGFKIENEFEDQDQSIPKFTGILTELRCIFGQNLEILTSTGGEWSCGQGQNSVNFDFQVKFDLEGQGQSTPKTIGILTKMFCMSGSKPAAILCIIDPPVSWPLAWHLNHSLSLHCWLNPITDGADSAAIFQASFSANISYVLTRHFAAH